VIELSRHLILQITHLATSKDGPTLMGKSGIPWVDATFDWAVLFLLDLAQFLGISYEEINIWIFLVLWPVLTVILITWIVKLALRCRKLGQEVNP